MLRQLPASGQTPVPRALAGVAGAGGAGGTRVRWGHRGVPGPAVSPEGFHAGRGGGAADKPVVMDGARSPPGVCGSRVGTGWQPQALGPPATESPGAVPCAGESPAEGSLSHRTLPMCTEELRAAAGLHLQGRTIFTLHFSPSSPRPSQKIRH